MLCDVVQGDRYGSAPVGVDLDPGLEALYRIGRSDGLDEIVFDIPGDAVCGCRCWRIAIVGVTGEADRRGVDRCRSSEIDSTEVASGERVRALDVRPKYDVKTGERTSFEREI